MSKELKSNLIKYGCCVFVCGLAAWGIMAYDGFSSLMPDIEKYRILCDAFMVPGTLSLMVGLLIWVANKGTLDSLTWALTNMVKSLFPGWALTKESYRDYVERKNKNRLTGYGFLLIVGLAFLAVSVVYLILFLKLFNA